MAIILAAGDGTRWKSQPSDYPCRHLLPVFGEPLIRRTVRMVKKYSDGKIPCLILAKDDALLSLPGSMKIEEKNKCAEILAVKRIWGDRTHILLGDVLYSDEAMAQILGYKEPLAFFGDERGGELFSMSFWKSDEWVERDLEIAAAHFWNLWQALRSAIGVPLERNLRDDTVWRGLFGDKITRDFDYPNQYQNFLKDYETKE